MEQVNSGKTNQLWDKIYVKIILILLVALYVYFINNNSWKVGIVLSAIPVLLIALAILFFHPRVTFIILFIYNYFAMGINRYVPGPLGLGVDGLLVLTFLGLFIRSYRIEVGFWRMKNELVLLALAWYLYAILELFNPIAESRIAWFYAMRGFALYFFLTVSLSFVIFTKLRDLHLILKLWMIFSVLGVIKGVQQLYFGMDYAEQAWLDNGGALTHIIWSGLRVFSFFTDAGQYGASMAHSAVVFSILAFAQKSIKWKIILLIISALCFYGMSISGTRGAMAVPIAGYGMFLLITKNWKIFIISAIFVSMGLGVLKFTSIGQGNDQIRRMRSAFDTNDASLQTRLNNQKRLKEYLADKPFGAGMGTTGSFGTTYTPHLLASQIPADSWYVAIWIEQGIVGLMLHISILLYCIARGAWIILFKLKDRQLSITITAILCGFVGIVGASYGNTVLGQMPTSIISYMSLAFIFMSPMFQRQIDEEEKNKNSVIILESEN